MKFKRLSGIAGILAPLMMIGISLLASALKPGFSWSDDSLSSIAGDVGDRPIWSATGGPAILFNIGLIIAGSALFVFALGLRKITLLHGSIGQVGAKLYLAPGILLSLVGIFPLTLGPIHDIVSYSLFLINPIAMIIIGIGLQSKNKGVGKITIVLAICALLPFFLPFPFSGLAIPEMLAIIPTTIFVFIFSKQLLSGRAHIPNREEPVDIDGSEP